MNHDIYKAGQVARYHCNPEMSLFRQTNADHQWGCVALILMMHKNPSVCLLRAAAFHDVGEMKAGDLPYTVKIENPEHATAHDELEYRMSAEMGAHRPPLNQSEKDWLKFVDRLESYLFMKLYGQDHQWSPEQLKELFVRAQKLNVTNRLRELIYGGS